MTLQNISENLSRSDGNQSGLTYYCGFRNWIKYDGLSSKVHACSGRAMSSGSVQISVDFGWQTHERQQLWREYVDVNRHRTGQSSGSVQGNIGKLADCRYREDVDGLNPYR